MVVNQLSFLTLTLVAGVGESVVCSVGVQPDQGIHTPFLALADGSGPFPLSGETKQHGLVRVTVLALGIRARAGQAITNKKF